MSIERDINSRLQRIEQKHKSTRRSTALLFISGVAALAGTYLALNSEFEEVSGQSEAAVVFDTGVAQRTIYVGDGSLAPESDALVLSCQTSQEELRIASVDEAPTDFTFLGLH